MLSDSKLDSSQIIEKIVAITSGVSVNMVHKDEFLDLRAETGEMLSKVNELNNFKERVEQNVVDDHYQVIKNQHQI